jgi:uncharacterized membrane protein YfcA
VPLDAVGGGTGYLVALLAGAGAGGLNAVVGAGTLVTYPVLVALGLPPLAANVTSAVGVFPGSLAGAYAYRERLRGVRRLAITATAAMCAGALGGVLLLLLLPSGSFARVVPWLIILAGALVLLQPMINRAARSMRRPPGPRAAAIGCGAAGVYLSYFGAATGVITLTSLLLGGTKDLQDANAIKNVATGVGNGLAAVIFMVFADVHFGFALAVAVGAILGGSLGGRFAQRLSQRVMRVVIFLVAVIAAVAASRLGS